MTRAYAIGMNALGINPVGISATFNLDERAGSDSIIQIASLVDRALIDANREVATISRGSSSD